MAYVNNGTERSLKVKVYKSVGGNYAQGYPKTYDGQLAFPGYSTLTDTEVRQLNDVDFATRLAAFESYVESVESGVDFDTDIVGYGATRENAACLEITTTTLAPVYAFSIRYGYLPVDACNGTAAIVYSNKSNPGVGDFLYKDPALSIPWNTVAGSSVLFMSPKVHGDEVVGVAIVDTTEYDPGEIMLLTGFSCSGVITPTTYYYNASQFACPPNCNFISSGWVISSVTQLTPGKYYVGSGTVFICGSQTTESSSAVPVGSTAYDSCTDASC